MQTVYSVKRFFRRWFNDEPRYAWQRVFRGYDDAAWWSLDIYLAKIAAPILKRMADGCPGYPPDLTPEEWSAILRKMQRSMELIIESDMDSVAEAETKEGLELFAKWFRHLWT